MIGKVIGIIGTLLLFYYLIKWIIKKWKEQEHGTSRI
jgi:hypothetical protein